jgi:Carbohydrate esterase, sialic acid-specific acetylesterase
MPLGSRSVRRIRTGCVAWVLAGSSLAGSSLATPVAAPASAGATGWSTTCDSAVREAADFRPVRGLDLPTQANWLGTTPPYAFDDTAAVADGFDRVGYCLELVGPDGPAWVWTSMAALDSGTDSLGLPTMPGEVWQRFVDDLTVRSNQTAVPRLTNGAGWVEMWPNQYSMTATRQVPGGSEAHYDADDTPTTPGYGSFQVHAFTQADSSRGPRTAATSTATPVLAVNAFTSAPRPLDVGIGTSPGQHPDWTFAGNAAGYTSRRLTVYARPAAARVETFPGSRQLIARPGRTAAEVPLPVTGEVVDPAVTAVELRVEQGARRWTQRVPVTASKRRFSFTVRLPVALISTDLELWVRGRDGARRIARTVDVVAGDAFVVTGQSNAVARQFNGSSEADRSRWVRTFGSSSADPDLAATDGWSYAVGDTSHRIGAIGQWSVRMGQQLAADRGVPVAIVNGAFGGQPIDHFARDDSQPDDPATNYGRLLRRLTMADLAGPGAIDALLWYQGETDADNAVHHVAGFEALVADWRQDLGRDLPVYAHQVRTSPCQNSETIALRDAQRRLPDSIANLRVLSTSDLNGHDGCHYGYPEGYRSLGEHDVATLLADLYHRKPSGVRPPDPRHAHRVADRPTEIVVSLRARAERLVVEPGAAADFRVPGAAVHAVEFAAGRGLVLTLDRPVPASATVAYVGHLRAGPRITNARGIGLLAFRLPVESVRASAGSATDQG